MPEPDLIIEVEGGVVTAVYTNLSIVVAVYDHDAGVENGALGGSSSRSRKGDANTER